MTSVPAATLSALRDHGFETDDSRPATRVGGGDISAAWCLPTSSGRLFLKLAGADQYDMFVTEAEGLAELARPGAIRVPRVIAHGCHPDASYLALEWIDMYRGNREAGRMLGAGLATLHRQVGDSYGWHRHNRIGLTPQPNFRTTDWCEFWTEHRLRHQLDRAAGQGYRGKLLHMGDELIRALPALLHGHRPEASLLHGDLWGGNWAVADDVPVIFDPAVYYGDREADLAMTRLFGGFDAGFYEAYEDAWPLSAGHEVRLPIYQLYHVLNHLNLFGSGYLGHAEALLGRILAATR